jgi:hypothetical protein
MRALHPALLNHLVCPGRQVTMPSDWDTLLILAGIVVMLIALGFYFNSQSERRKRADSAVLQRALLLVKNARDQAARQGEVSRGYLR